MNRFILSILAVLFPLHVLGQMFPLSDHYEYNALAINPAFAGCHDALSTTISYRDQWVGFKDAPKSYMLSVHTPIYNDRIGLGLIIEKNSIGIFKETSFIGNYAYRMELRNGRLALGLGFGLTVYNIAWNELQANDANDAQLMNTSASTVLPAFSLGTYYYTKKYYVGISLPLFLSHELDKSTGKYKIGNNFSGSNFFFTGGYEVSITSQVKFLPSLLIKYHHNNTIQIDYNAQINLKDRIWLGIGYRNRNMLVGILQCQLNYQVRMAYSYDLNLGSIGRYTNGSHEVLLSYVLRYARKVMGPRQF
ncbi:MAG: type IX secretion system membrane protein PorP/SprF [Bacteroidetes bacterium]|nr:MAG: type IX secretion system membrane protein PorP/SprF [Bacteroidota bacterium]